MTNKISKIRGKIAEKGIFHYVKHLIKKIMRNLPPKYERLFMFEFNLTEPVEQIVDKSIIVGRLDTYSEIMDEFAEKRGDWYKDQAKDLFSKGNICFAAIIDGKIASCLWTSFNEVFLPDVEYKLKTPPNIAPLIDGYTLDEYRGKGLYKILWNDCLNYLISSKKYIKIYGFINNKNKRSIKVHDKLNLNKIILDIQLFRILGIKIHIKKKIS
jgi:hypothetical protein